MEICRNCLQQGWYNIYVPVRGAGGSTARDGADMIKEVATMMLGADPFRRKRHATQGAATGGGGQRMA
eukprot:1101354-Pleurochrysis_carterae.AAC.3